MGNTNTKRSDDYSSSSNRKKSNEFVDQQINYGSLVTKGIYTSTPEYDIDVVRGFILKKKLSPFYKGMEDYSDNPYPGASSSSNNQDTLNESTNQNLTSNNDNSINKNNNNDSNSIDVSKKKSLRRNSLSESRGRRSRHGSFSSSKFKNSYHNNGNKSDTEDSIYSSSPSFPSSTSSIKVEPGHSIYSKEEFFKYPIECPICFLYYPRNINYTRCCDQPICTECFIQIKRTFQNPEPTCCPYCVQPNFGVTYLSPDSEEYQNQYEVLVKAKEQHDPNFEKLLSQGSTPGKKRRNVISHTDPHIVTSDDIYPGWMLKYEQYQREQQRLEAMRARNFNAQVNNNAAIALLNAFLQLPIPEANNIRRNRNDSSLQNIGNDLEEIMLLEAIRRSLADGNNSNSIEEVNNLTTIEETNNNTQATSNENENTSNLSITNAPEETTENIIDSSSLNENEVINTYNTINNSSTSNDNNTTTNNSTTINQDNENKNDNHEETGSEKNIINNNNNNNNLDSTENTANDNIESAIIDSTTSKINS
ncbi:hypothetical protein H8356DRAFT_1275865 [Neocallimastix lanati (nom. inval.)]|jgi:hypothetical protein|uniref:RING-type domain-containing protein n=1 Tax=Neocallimastix californiae TaxID=1754190 RepID=A0A1Y2AQ02_9FUNG|nr:hypothetical protein H8356DRAFT_1275865 [Neocallimastix sp. JGI-2020a]ORY24602.1 hypothetical protein LY90DRAFT_675120 [Neocallimastix californiae]|eukprot:ORY24602.1 hypothetical protein LY90DRAFT_675120 [Neocallimastix californiae]